MNLNEYLNKLFIPDISNIIIDFHVGYDKQIADAHHNKKTFNAIMKHIFNEIYNPWSSDYLFPLMFTIHKSHVTSIIACFPLSGYRYDPLILEYRKKYIEIIGDSWYRDLTYEEQERKKLIIDNHPGYKTYNRIYTQNKKIIEEVHNKLNLKEKNKINAIRLGLI